MNIYIFLQITLQEGEEREMGSTDQNGRADPTGSVSSARFTCAPFDTSSHCIEFENEYSQCIYFRRKREGKREMKLRRRHAQKRTKIISALSDLVFIESLLEIFFAWRLITYNLFSFWPARNVTCGFDKGGPIVSSSSLPRVFLIAILLFHKYTNCIRWYRRLTWTWDKNIRLFSHA